jgi:hypothetical protein
MAADELLVHRARDLLEAAFALLLEEEGQKVHLEDEVPELVRQLGSVAGDRGVGDLVGLLDRMGNDRPRSLLAVPWTLAAQRDRQPLELDEGVGEPARGALTGRFASYPRWSRSRSSEARSRPDT